MLTYEVTNVDYGIGFDVCTIGEDSDIGRSLRSSGEYEKNVADLLDKPRHYLNERTFIDFGAHWGTFSVLMAMRGCEKVFAFEPNPANFYALCQTIIINECEGQIIPFPFAALDVLGPANLLLSNTCNTGNHRVDLSGGGATEQEVLKVMGVPANLLLDKCTPYIAKLDIQGSEILALRGCKGLQIDFAVIERWEKFDEELAAYFGSTRIVGDQMVCVDFKYPMLNVG